MRAISLIFVSLVCFLLVHLIHFLVWPPKIILYSALLDAAISQVLFLLLWFFRFRRWVTFSEVLLVTYAGLVSAGFYSVMIPTVIDRSVSLYLLRYLDAQGGVMNQQEFEKQALTSYYDEMHVFEQRIHEQLATESIVVEGATVKLTEKGRLVLKWTNLYRDNFLPPADRY